METRGRGGRVVTGSRGRTSEQWVPWPPWERTAGLGTSPRCSRDRSSWVSRAHRARRWSSACQPGPDGVLQAQGRVGLSLTPSACRVPKQGSGPFLGVAWRRCSPWFPLVISAERTPHPLGEGCGQGRPLQPAWPWPGPPASGGASGTGSVRTCRVWDLPVGRAVGQELELVRVSIPSYLL